MKKIFTTLLVSCSLLTACKKSAKTHETAAKREAAQSMLKQSPGVPVLVAAGDIASCDDLSGAIATAKLLDRISGTVFAAGDLPHPDGSAEEFRDCYGDGACAFVLSCFDGATPGQGYHLGDFISGCAGAHASSLRLRLSGAGSVIVDFKGEELAGAAISTLDRVLQELEGQSGTPRSEVGWFALHQPNPRILKSLADRAKIPLAKAPVVAQHAGNLGSATCGVALCKALEECEADARGERPKMIFIAAVGPGLLWAGTYVSVPPSEATSAHQSRSLQ